MPTITRNSKMDAHPESCASPNTSPAMTLGVVSPITQCYLQDNSNNIAAGVLLELVSSNGQLALSTINRLLESSAESLAGEFQQLVKGAPIFGEIRELVTIFILAFMHQASRRLLDLSIDGGIDMFPRAYCTVSRLIRRLSALMPQTDAESDSTYLCPYIIPTPYQSEEASPYGTRGK